MRWFSCCKSPLTEAGPGSEGIDDRVQAIKTASTLIDFSVIGEKLRYSQGACDFPGEEASFGSIDPPAVRPKANADAFLEKSSDMLMNFSSARQFGSHLYGPLGKRAEFKVVNVSKGGGAENLNVQLDRIPIIID